MKISALLCAAATSLLISSCVTSPSQAHDHWNSASVAPQMSRIFLGYEPDIDGAYVDYQWQNKLHIAKTLQRHFLNHNPDNPFQPDDPDYYAPRPVHSPLPNPLNYFHFESLVIGAVLYSGGTFIPLPVDSLIATLAPGGPEEFVAGLDLTFKPMRVITVSFLDDYLNMPPVEGEEQINICAHQTTAE
jgi:hypothetical protein